MPNAASNSVELNGNIEERYFSQGVGARNRWSSVLACFRELPDAPALPQPWFQRGMEAVLTALGTFYLRRHRSALEAFDGGRYLRGLEALAAGFRVSPQLLFGVQITEVLTSNFGYEAGCSALSFPAEATEAGNPWLAYNHDFPPAFAPFLQVRRNEPQDALRSLMVSYPVALGCIAGVNEAGLALTVNHAHSTDHHRRPSVLVTMLAHHMLERCASVKEALDAAREVRVPNGSMITLVDKSGDRAVLELSATRQGVRRPSQPGGVGHTFNKYRVPSLEEVEIPLGAVGKGLAKGYDVHFPNVERERRYQALAPSFPKVWSIQQVQALLSDHHDGTPHSGTLCRHNDPRSETILHALMDPKAGTLQVLFGFPCEQSLRTHALGRRRRRKAA